MRTSWQSSLPPRPWSTKIEVEKVEKVEKVTMVELCWAMLSSLSAERRFRGRLLIGGITWPRFVAPKLCQGLYHEGASCSNLDRCCMSASKIVSIEAIHIWLILTCGPFMQTTFFGWCCAIATWSTCGESFQDSLKIGHGLAPVLGFCKLTRFKAGHIAKNSRRICHIPRFHANANAWAMAMILCPMVLILLRREIQPTRKTQGRSEKVKKKKCHLRDHHGIMIGEQFALWIPRENRERIVCFFFNPRL